jgi:DNA repair protein RecO (recombination protein O)
MDNISVEGLVIRTIHYNESSEIVHLLTKGGIISVMCKGARRYKSHKLSFCIPLTRVNAIITDSKVPTLIDYSIIDSYDYIKDDLKANLWFSYLLEILNKLQENNYFSHIYKMLIRCLELAYENDAMKLVLTCQVKLLKAFGVEPELKYCVKCHKNDIKFFSIKEGGFLCEDENASDRVDYKLYLPIKKIYYFDIYNEDFKELNNIDFKDVFSKITAYYQYHIDIEIHSLSSLII